jgi:hypothetical protein
VLAAVGGAEDSALLVRAVRMTEDCDEDAVRITRIDENCADLLTVSKSHVTPTLPAVGRLIDAVADGEVRSLQAFAARDVDHIRIGRRDGERAD